MDYLPYYERAINHHQVGLKLVVGGTGLGKTGVIPTVVGGATRQEKKCLYIANRHQLLVEMARKLKPDEYRLLPRDLDAVIQTLRHYRSELYQLMDTPQFQNIARARHIDLTLVKRICEELSDIEEYENLTAGRLREQLDRDARSIVMHAFRTVIQNTANQKYREKLLDNPAIQSLFPFIAFQRRGEVQILLMTLQKAFHGFFDGQQKVNLADLDGFIIFLDEFDFLENDLSGLICAAPQISNVFRFVEFFYQEMERHKLPLPTYPLPNAESYRKRIERIAAAIKSLHNRGINYPQINQFTRPPDKGNASIFRTGHVITSAPLYLHQTDRAFDVLDNAAQVDSGRIFPAQELFRSVGNLSERIITLLKSLEIEAPIIYDEMRQQCYSDTVFDQEIQQITYFPPKRRARNTQLDALLEYGYSLYDIFQLGQETDKEEVKLQSYSIYTTPERILQTLMSKNLVFGLSATADIPRCVHHFDLEWLSHQTGVNVIPIDDEDVKVVEALNTEKAQRRGHTQVQVVELSDLIINAPLQRSIQKFVEAVSKDEDFGEGHDTKEKHRSRRVERFFASLLWICQKPQEVAGLSHLMFLNSFRQIKLTLARYGDQDPAVFRATQRTSNRWFDVYDLTFCNQAFTAVLYDAEQAKQIRRNKDAEDTFNGLFHEGVPVIVITQYLSAGNGVNLQYLPAPTSSKDDEQDFLNLHLLEVPFFYFGDPNKAQTTEEKTAALKENIWYQAKLFAAKHISEARFRRILSQLHEPASWNSDYQNHAGTRGDALLNNLATLIQALGRVERTWVNTPRQTVVMSREVISTFRAYMSEDYEYIRLGREPTISYNLKQVLDQIAAQLPAFEQERHFRKDSDFPDLNARCEEKIGELVKKLERVRREGDLPIRQEWEFLREAMLKHDFHHELVKRYLCSYQSPYVSGGRVYVNAENELIHEQTYDPHRDWCWYLDMAYELVGEHPIIRKHFAAHGFELSFQSGVPYLFTPYSYQAILMGAIGEEACKALLRHEHIRLEPTPYELFEIADLKVANAPIYIDCKNYTDATMTRFELSEEDLYWHPRLNATHFKVRARQKWEQIAKLHDDPRARLIFLNLASRHEAAPEYYDATLNPVARFEDAQMIIVRGCLQIGNAIGYHSAFQHLLFNLHQNL